MFTPCKTAAFKQVIVMTVLNQTIFKIFSWILKDFVYSGSLSGAEALRPEFDKNPLFLGGDVGGAEGGNILQLLHNQRQLAKSVEIVDGVYLGGYEAAKMAVRREELDPVATCRCFLPPAVVLPSIPFEYCQGLDDTFTVCKLKC